MLHRPACVGISQGSVIIVINSVRRREQGGTIRGGRVQAHKRFYRPACVGRTQHGQQEQHEQLEGHFLLLWKSVMMSELLLLGIHIIRGG